MINPIGGEASRPFFSAVRDSGLVYIYSMFGEVVSLPASATGRWLGSLYRDAASSVLDGKRLQS